METLQFSIQIDFLFIIVWLFIGCIPPIFYKAYELDKILDSRSHYRYSQKFEISLADCYTFIISTIAGPLTIVFLLLAVVHDFLYDLNSILFQKSFDSKFKKDE